MSNPSITQPVARLAVSSVIARGDGFLTAEIDDEIVALSIDKGTCYNLNKTASRIWNAIVTPSRISDICSVLVAQYEIDRGTCERQVLDLLEELRAEGLIVTSEAP